MPRYKKIYDEKGKLIAEREVDEETREYRSRHPPITSSNVHNTNHRRNSTHRRTPQPTTSNYGNSNERKPRSSYPEQSRPRSSFPAARDTGNIQFSYMALTDSYTNAPLKLPRQQQIRPLKEYSRPLLPAEGSQQIQQQVPSQQYGLSQKAPSLPTNKPKEVQNVASQLTYKIGRLLGDGTYANVYEAQDYCLNRIVAAKEFKPTSYAKDSVKKEVAILAKLNHRAIVQYLRHEFSPQPVIIFEKLEGDLYDLTNETLNSYRGSIMWVLLNNILSGIEYLGSETINIVHRDIKPANVFLEIRSNKPSQGIFCTLRQGAYLRFKLGDVGLAQPQNTTADLGTPGYTAPELFLYYNATTKSDIWSFFATMVWVWDRGWNEVLTSKNDAENFERLCKVARNPGNFKLPHLGEHDAQIRGCLPHMGWADRIARASVKDILSMLSTQRYFTSPPQLLHEDVVKKVKPKVRQYQMLIEEKEKEAERERIRLKEEAERERIRLKEEAERERIRLQKEEEDRKERELRDKRLREQDYNRRYYQGGSRRQGYRH